MAIKFYARKPINHKGTHYRPGDEIAGFTGWWRYWQYLRYARVAQVTTVDPPPAATVPAAPTALVATPTDTSVSIAFTAGADGGAAITNYEYSVDSGAWTAFTPADTTSPVSITGLTAETEYSVRLRAINSVGNGTASAAVTFTTSAPPATAPDAPTDLVATTGVLSVSIAFVAPDDGGSAITDYEYTLTDGATWTSGGITASPLVLDPIPSVSTTVKIRAVNAVGAGTASAGVTFTPDSE